MSHDVTVALSPSGAGRETKVYLTPDQIAARELANNPLPTMDQLIAYAAQRRWEAETGGIAVNGLPIPTDDRAKLMIKGRADTAVDENEYKLVMGAFRATLTGLEFKTIHNAITDHVQACFDVQDAVVGDIEVGIVTTFAEIDAASWPA